MKPNEDPTDKAERSSTALSIAKAALVIGLLGDVLLRVTPWGLNVLLFNLAFIGAFLWLVRRSGRKRLDASTIALLAAQLFFSAMFVWRDAIELRVADSFAILAVLSVLFLPRLQIAAKAAGVLQYLISFVWASLSSVFGPVLLLASDIGWSELPRDGWRRHTIAVVRGLLIALPLVLVFGALFVAADSAFERVVLRVLNVAPETMFSHVLIFTIFAWLSAGYLRGILMPIEKPAGSTSPRGRTWSWSSIDNSIAPAGLTLGAMEVGVILGAMNLLFLSFVIVQLPYLFGGMEMIQNTPDLKLADYARRGFGELVVVSALVLPMLLVGHWLIRPDSIRAGRVFRVLAVVQIGLLFIVMASAVQRLVLLTGSLGYGLTTVRLYPMIFVAWLAIVFVWFGFTVLREARQWFAWGALWSAFFVLGATHVLDPDAFIVRTNLALMAQGREFDTRYNSGLSTDAIPVLIDAMPDLSVEDRCEVGSAIHYRYRELGQISDVRSLNYSRKAAFYALRDNDALLHQTDGCPDQLKKDKNADGTDIGY